MEKLNVAIADDNVRMADILGQMIEEDKDLTLVGKAHNGEEICKETAGFYCSIGGGTGKNHRRCVQSWRILLYAETF